jgi:transcriptional regulator with XRE-family HTH domain
MCVKYDSVTDNINKLQDYVRRLISEKDLNYRQVARHSRGLISHGTVYDIISGRNLNPSLSSLRGLAKGLGVTEEELFACAAGKPLEKDTIDERLALIGLKFRELNDEQRIDAEALLRALEHAVEL